MTRFILLFITSFSLQANCFDNIVFESHYFGEYGMSSGHFEININQSTIVDRNKHKISNLKICDNPKLYCLSSDIINIAIPKANEKKWYFQKYEYKFDHSFQRYTGVGKELIRVIKKSGNDEPNQYYFLNSMDEIIGFAEQDKYKKSNKKIFMVTSDSNLNLKLITQINQNKAIPMNETP